jgi:hypothetical protein
MLIPEPNERQPTEVSSMRAVVIYESMYGNTHLVADAIGRGLADDFDVAVVPVGEASASMVAEADLVVVGGPTHIHGMSRETSRQSAATEAAKDDNELVLDADATGEGLREWFETLGPVDTRAAAFDTRFHMNAALTGRASKGIDKRLRHHGFTTVAPPESFFVERTNVLEAGEAARAAEWGRSMAERLRAEVGAPGRAG